MAILPTYEALTTARPVQDVYELLDAYYEQNNVYDRLAIEMRASGYEVVDTRALRNPAHRVVESYADNLWPGADLSRALPIVTENPLIVEPIEQIWAWSNWASRKQRAARWLALYGDMFLKAATRNRDRPTDEQRVYIQNIKPAWVTDFELDERGFVTWIRLDYVAARFGDDARDLYYHTEIWSKERQDMRVWERARRPADTSTPETDPIARLGSPQRLAEFRAMGIDFVPFVYQPLRDAGDERANGAFLHALEKIDEANRQAWTLHKRLYRYNRPDLALEGVGLDAQSRPMPPPMLENEAAGEISNVDGEKVWRLPSGWRISHLTAQLDYGAALDILNAHMKELENDLPELVYDRLTEEGSNISGRALRIKATKAIKRFEEARGNAESALVRVNQMCLTLGAQAGIWNDLGGTFEGGAFDHAFEARDISPLTTHDRAESFQLLMQQGGVPVKWALRRVGLLPQGDAEAEAEFDEQVAAEKAADARALATGVLQARASRDRGDTLGLEQP